MFEYEVQFVSVLGDIWCWGMNTPSTDMVTDFLRYDDWFIISIVRIDGETLLEVRKDA